MELDTGIKVGKYAVKHADNFGKIFSWINPFWDAKRMSVELYYDAVKASDMPPEAKMMAIAGTKQKFKHLINQQRVAQIALEEAAPGTDFSEKSNVDEEWLDRFMDATKFVSDEEIQFIWGKILAGEFEEPSSTPTSVIRILSEMTKRQADVFQMICCTEMKIRIKDQFDHILHEVKQPILQYFPKTYGFSAIEVEELQIIGLLQHEGFSGYNFNFAEEAYAQEVAWASYHYFDRSFTIPIQKQAVRSMENLPIGTVILTTAGKCIAKCLEKKKIDGHFETVQHYVRHAVKGY